MCRNYPAQCLVCIVTIQWRAKHVNWHSSANTMGGVGTLCRGILGEPGRASEKSHNCCSGTWRWKRQSPPDWGSGRGQRRVASGMIGLGGGHRRLCGPQALLSLFISHAPCPVGTHPLPPSPDSWDQDGTGDWTQLWRSWYSLWRLLAALLNPTRWFHWIKTHIIRCTRLASQMQDEENTAAGYGAWSNEARLCYWTNLNFHS